MVKAGANKEDTEKQVSKLRAVAGEIVNQHISNLGKAAETVSGHTAKVSILVALAEWKCWIC